jgi:transcriptional regulator with XRE-family HTH domain
MPNEVTAGELLRRWRIHRGLSQLALSINAEVSSRHLCFVETGRANPSREMIMRLAEELQIPLRQRNVLLTAAGYARMYPERALEDPALGAVGTIVHKILSGHEPNPAVAIDHQWRALAMNRTIEGLLDGVDSSLLRPPVNLMRVGLHPLGLATRIRNFAEWRANAIAKLRQRIEITADQQLVELLKEIEGYRYPRSLDQSQRTWRCDAAIPLELETSCGDVSLITTSMVFGYPRDVTVSEIAIECFFPQDKESAEVLKRFATKVRPVSTTETQSTQREKIETTCRIKAR